MPAQSGQAVAGTLTRFYPFGEWRTEPSVQLTDRGFTGHQHNNTNDNDLGLIYMNARFYVPGLGRFASADTIVPNPINPQSFNKFSYTRNNPLKFVDPTGHGECDADGNCNNQPPSNPPREPIELADWEKQLMAMNAYVEMHGHGAAQAGAITWVILNRIAGETPITGGTFGLNRNFSESSLAAGYILNKGQMAVGEIFANNFPELIKIGENGNYVLALDQTVEDVVSHIYNVWMVSEDKLGDISAAVYDAIDAYNSGASDPTGGSVFYGHITPRQESVYEDYLQGYAKDLNVSQQSEVHFFGSNRPKNPKTLITNNLTFVP